MELARDLLRKNASRILFLVLYTAMFILISKFLLLFLPFLLGSLLYFLIYPMYRFICRRTNISKKASANTVMILISFLITLITACLIFLICREITHLLSGESYFRFDELQPQVRGFIENVFARIPALTENLTDDLTGTLSTLLPYAGSTLKLFLSVPAVLILPVLAFGFTRLLLLNTRRLRRMLSAVIGPKKHLRLRHALKAQAGSSNGLMFSYILIFLITFAEACIILCLLNMPYPLITAVVVTVSDIFPILGPGTVLLPLCVYRLLCGAYMQSIGLLAGWLLITVIRQIIEPRLISRISRTPGIVMLTAVYTSLIFGNFWVIPYTALLFYLYRQFNDAGLFSRCERDTKPMK